MKLKEVVFLGKEETASFFLTEANQRYILSKVKNKEGEKKTRLLHAIFDGKVLCPEEPVDLQVNRHYLLTIELMGGVEGQNDLESDPAFDLSSLAVKTGIPDLATEHDHYLYGVPKRGVDARARNKRCAH